MAKSKLPVPSTLPVTPCRIVYCRSWRWVGPLPAIVVRVNEDRTVNVNVFGDDTAGASFQNTTARSLRLFDALSDDERIAMLSLDQAAEWCEWPLSTSPSAAVATVAAVVAAEEKKQAASSPLSTCK